MKTGSAIELRVPAVRSGQRPTIILVSVLAISVIYFLVGSPHFYERVLGSYTEQGSFGFLAPSLYHFAVTLVLFFLLPVAIVKNLLGEKLSAYGWQAGDRRAGWISLAWGVPLVLLLGWISAGRPEFQSQYPLFISRLEDPFQLQGQNITVFILYQFTYVFYYLGWEFFFRGFALFGLKDSWGLTRALLFQALLSTALHATKPLPELLAALPGGDPLWPGGAALPFAENGNHRSLAARIFPRSFRPARRRLMGMGIMLPSRYNRLSEHLILAYLVFLTIFILVFRAMIVSWGWLLLAQVAAAALLALLVSAQKRRPASRLAVAVRNWLPLPYILYGYKMITYLINSDRNPGFMVIRDRWLIAADRWLFGGDPTVWLQRLTVPWLTEAMQLFYATNYFLPLILVLVLYRKRERFPFQKSVFAITLGYILSYLGYFIIPAIGPRFTIYHAVPLEGILIREQLAALIYCMEACPRDCFPSGHTEIPLIALWLAFRFRRKLFYLYLPIVTGLVLSTVYLRYHYVIDVIAGAALAGMVILLAGGAEKRIGSTKTRLPAARSPRKARSPGRRCSLP